MVDQLAFLVNQSTDASVSRFNNAATFEHGHFDEIEWLWQKRRNG
jgi:hypothetical protein